MRKFNEDRVKLSKAALTGMLGFLLIFSCKSASNEEGRYTYTLSITKPTNGTLSSNAGGIDCGSEGITCKAEFSKETEVTLTATADTGYAPGTWSGVCESAGTKESCSLSINKDKIVGKVFHLNVDTDNDGIIDALDDDDDNDKILDKDDVDDDGDGLIEIYDLDMFNNIRNDLGGTSYKTSDSATADRTGAPTKPTVNCTTIVTDTSVYLCGYELMRDLDFAQGDSYAGGSVNTDWRPLDASGNVIDAKDASNAGFTGANNFAGIFEGNGHSISRLYSRNTTSSATDLGLFRSIAVGAAIRSLGVKNANLYGNADSDNIGALVGSNSSSISASYAKDANINGGDGNDYVGGLVGLSRYPTGGSPEAATKHHHHG